MCSGRTCENPFSSAYIAEALKSSIAFLASPCDLAEIAAHRLIVSSIIAPSLNANLTRSQKSVLFDRYHIKER